MKLRKQALLAIDIGNSTIGLGFYPDASKKARLLAEKVSLDHVKTSAALTRIVIHLLKKCGMNLKLAERSIGVVISSVVPELNHSVIEAVKSFCPDPLVITHTSATGLTLEVSHPERLGSDRIVNAVAGFHHFGKPVAVVDVGTATTITVVGRRANLLGGTIMPGINMMRESLASNTAGLPLIFLSKPSCVLGHNTDSAIASGVINGTVGATEYIVSRIEKEVRMKLNMILTGGHAGLVAPLMKRDHVVLPNLIFEGMRLIYNRET